jgi:hypothetical protein
MRYTYKMVQVPPTISIRARDYRGGEAAAYLESVVNQYAVQGWEFYRVDSIGVQVAAGCLAALFGSGPQQQTYYVITFRAAGPPDLPKS